MNLLSTDLAATVAAVLVAVSAWAIRSQAHARHEARVRLLRETTESLQRKADQATRFGLAADAGNPDGRDAAGGPSLQIRPSRVFPG